MECQECHIRPAALHFTKIVNGDKVEYHLCEQCAKEKGHVMSASSSFTIHDLLSGLLNFDQPLGGKQEKKVSVLECPKCGLTYSQFAKSGKFGCDECYYTFDEKLDPVFRRVHSGNTLHKGKVPKRAGKDLNQKKQISALKEEMKKHIENEEFEQAADVRDEIRALENRRDKE